jgi:hypothetical protein
MSDHDQDYAAETIKRPISITSDDDRRDHWKKPDHQPDRTEGDWENWESFHQQIEDVVVAAANMCLGANRAGSLQEQIDFIRELVLAGVRNTCAHALGYADWDFYVLDAMYNNGLPPPGDPKLRRVRGR